MFRIYDSYERYAPVAEPMPISEACKKVQEMNEALGYWRYAMLKTESPK
jgi:hypothetical protein